MLSFTLSIILSKLSWMGGRHQDVGEHWDSEPEFGDMERSHVEEDRENDQRTCANGDGQCCKYVTFTYLR